MGYGIISEKLFDINHVNPNAKVVIVGISPGSSQSFCEKGVYIEGNKTKSNQNCAFRGNTSIHSNLIKMLNYLGINNYLGIRDCASLWDEDFNKVNFTSVLPFSVLKIMNTKQDTYLFNEEEIKEKVKNKEYKFISKIETKDLKRPLLEENYRHFLKAVDGYENNPIFIACGPFVYNVLLNIGKIPSERIIPISHPSGANSEGVKVYIEEITDFSNRYHKNYCEKVKKLSDEAKSKLHNILNK